MMYRRFLVVVVSLIGMSAAAQDKPPAINPAAARLEQTIGSLDGPAFAVAYNEQAGLLAAACENGVIQYWEKDVILGIRTGEKTPNILRGHKGPVTCLAWTTGPVLASGADKKIILWGMPDGKSLHTLDAGHVVRALAMSPDGKLLAAAGDGKTVQLWEVATGKPGKKLEGHTDWILALAFTPDGKTLASGGYDGVIRLWEVEEGKQLREFASKPPPPDKAPPGPANIVWSLAFSPDGKTLAVGGSEAQIHFCNVADGKIVRTMPGHTSTITGLAFHPTGTVLASSSKDRAIKLWNATNGQAIKSLEGHTAWAQGLTFLAQGTRLASVGADQSLRLWDLTEAPKK